MINSEDRDPPPVLGRTSEYALRALLVIAHCGNGRPISADAIAELTGMPANYLGKILYALGRAGLVRSTRGPSGGFELALTPDEITIASIDEVFREAATPPRCLLGTGPCNHEHPCAAHHMWKRVTLAAREPLLQTTVAALLCTEPGRPVPLSC